MSPSSQRASALHGNHAHWVPVDLVWCDNRPVVELRQVACMREPEPFWPRRQPPTGPCRLQPLDAVPEPTMAPAGFLFHMLRCGSTLACSLLGQHPKVVTLSEPLLFQSLLSGRGEPRLRASRLRRLMALHASVLCGDRDQLIVKWTSLACSSLPILVAAFPAVPTAFVHRDPVEVLVSCLARRPASATRIETQHLAPHLRAPTLAQQSSPELMARFVASCCFHAAEADRIGLVDYSDLPAAAWGGLARHFGLASSAFAPEAVQRVSAVHAKFPSQAFSGDRERKQADASAEIRHLAEVYVAPERARLLSQHSALTL